MNVLAIDGALAGFSAAVTRRGSVVATVAESGNVALERGLAAVDLVLSRAEMEPAELDRLGVGAGPGSFTGLRIAIAYAKSFALAWSLPLVAVPSFDALELGRSYERVLTIVVGRPGVISARLRSGDRVARCSGFVRDVLAALVPVASAPLAVVGASEDVLAALAERRTVVEAFDPIVNPPAAAVAAIAAIRHPHVSAHAIEADYGELPAARVPKL